MRAFIKVAATALLLAFAPVSESRSAKRRPLDYVSKVDNPIIHTPSHRLHSGSSFDLSFFLHDEQQKIRLSLEPNHAILSDSASITYLGPDGSPVRAESINRADHKVFKGHTFVEHPFHSEWINTGFARISVHRDGPNPIFEGVFRVNGNHHHIQTDAHYRETQDELDPQISVAEDEYMIVWRDTDVSSPQRDAHGELRRDVDTPQALCSSNQLQYNNDLFNPGRRNWNSDGLSAVPKTSLLGRSDVPGGNGPNLDLKDSIGSTVGCPGARKVALVGVAVDCTYRQKFSTEGEMRKNVIAVVNQASGVYEETFNISLGLANLTISHTSSDPNDTECPGSPPANSPWNQDCSPDVDIFDRLNLFSQWRGQFTDTNAFWTLLTTCETTSAVGLSWLGQLCATGSSTQPGGENGQDETFAGANVVVKTSTEWQVFAHEVGHTFGAVHDCVDQTCSSGDEASGQCCPLSTSTCDAQGQFMMNPETSGAITQFSPCSIGNICAAIGTNNVQSTCLTDNKDVVTITGAQCGNGIVEQGEECDCGGEEGCVDNQCCDSKTCKFLGDAVCDATNEDCCTSQCQFASKGTVCRASTSDCDPEETCPGSSATCPEDNKSDDGTDCGNGLKCASGQCTSRDLQCQAVVGSTSQNDTTACNPDQCILACNSPTLGPEQCYNMNQIFLDGTPCGSGGKCQDGTCQGSSSVNEFLQLLRDHEDIVIPVCASVGGLIVLSILWCCISSCRRRGRRNRHKAAMKQSIPPLQPPPARQSTFRSSAPGGAAWSANNGGYPVPPPAAARGSPSMSGPHGPVPSNPSMSGSRLWQDEGSPHQWTPPTRRSTMRYA